MGRPPGSAKHQLAPVVRGAFVRALDIIQDKKGKTLPELMYEAINEHGILMVMKSIAPYIERETKVDLTSNGVSLIEVLSTISGARHDPPVESEPESIRH